MAKESARSFGEYSGIDQQRALQVIPNAVKRQDPAVREKVRDVAPWALGLSERGATQSGRSWMDPGRQAERWARGTGSAQQTQAAQQAQEEEEQADPIAAARKRAFGNRNEGQRLPVPLVLAVIPQSVANPGGGDVAPQPFQPAVQVPNIFVNPTTTSPAASQSAYSIGAAMNGSGLTLAPYQYRPTYNPYL